MSQLLLLKILLNLLLVLACKLDLMSKEYVKHLPKLWVWYCCRSR